MKRIIFFISIAIALTAMPASAATYYVGPCHAGSFARIMDAINSLNVAPGSTIKVCPGTYKEQVTVYKSLTLQGINNASGSVTIVGSTSDLSIYGHGSIVLRPSIWVIGTPANISNINIMQTYADTDCSSQITGIVFTSGTSGKVNHVNVSIQPTTSAGCANSVGIWAENSSSSAESVSVLNSTFEVGYLGVEALSVPPSSLSATLTGNQFFSGAVNANGSTGIVLDGVTGSATANLIVGPIFGILVSGSPQVIGNTINASQGIALAASSTPSVTKNTIRANVGIDFGCNIPTVSSNVLFGGWGALSTTGLSSVPLTYSGANSFFNVGSWRLSC